MLCAVVRGWKLRARRRGKFCNFRFKPLLPAHEAQGIERSDAAKKRRKTDFIVWAGKKIYVHRSHGAY